MAYKAFYRKYRPASFADVVGQEHITVTLKNELAAGAVSHAYLFTGTRGTGKTTCAKILANAINCLSPNNGDPCGECEMCRGIAAGEVTDIAEIDAASNNGVENIRELREQVNFTPAAAKYRVYIIDEVHMLSIGAFNALLKTLEEPPPHVVFILATTEVHKLPATILSRCQRFDFRRIDPQCICKRLQMIAKEEGFTLTDAAAMLIASAADGGMRDALSILDLCAAGSSEIDESVVERVCAMAGNEYLLKLSGMIRERNTEQALLLLDELHSSSVDMLRLLSELTQHYRDLMILKTVKSATPPVVCTTAQLEALRARADSYELGELLSILSVFQETAGKMQSGNRRCEMEMAIVRLCSPQNRCDLASLERRIALLEANRPAGASAPAAVKPEAKQPAAPAEPEPEDAADDDEIPLPPPPPDPDETASVPAAEAPAKSAPAVNGAAPVGNWEDVLYLLRQSCPLIAGVLSGSSAYIKGNYLLIDTDNSQFRALVNGDKPIYRDQIRKAAQQVLGVEYKLGPYRAAKETASDPLAAFADRLNHIKHE